MPRKKGGFALRRYLRRQLVKAESHRTRRERQRRETRRTTDGELRPGDRTRGAHRTSMPRAKPGLAMIEGSCPARYAAADVER